MGERSVAIGNVRSQVKVQSHHLFRLEASR